MKEAEALVCYIIINYLDQDLECKWLGVAPWYVQKYLSAVMDYLHIIILDGLRRKYNTGFYTMVI